jgi:hypothetical protein
MKTTTLGTVLLLFALFTSAVSSPPPAHAQTYYLRSMGGAPLPFDPYDGAEPIVVLDYNQHIYQVQDNTNDYEMLITAKQLDAMSSTMSADSIDPNGGTNDSGGGTYTNNFQSYVYGSNDLWLEVTQVDMVNQHAFLTLHGTIPGDHYQLLSTNQLNGNGETWTLGQYITGAANTNQTAFATFNVGTNSQLFFWAHHANPVVGITPGTNAIEPANGNSGRVGNFQVRSYYALSNNLPVYYTIGGTAQNGIDYSTISGMVTLTPTQLSSNISIAPIADSLVEGIETVTLSIQQTNSYLIDPAASAATITIADSSTTLSVSGGDDMYKPGGPPGAAGFTGHFQFTRSDALNLFPAITAYYTVSGTASNGEDYAFLSGSIDFPAGQSSVSAPVTPLSDSIDFDGLQTVVVTLVPTNNFIVSSNGNSALDWLYDSTTTVGIERVQDATETNIAGIFHVYRDDDLGQSPQMTVNYLVTGTASNGVDYQTLSGTVTFADGLNDTNIYVQPIQDDLLEGDETVTLTILPNGNQYFTDDASNATIVIHDSVKFLTVAPLTGPIGIDYYAPSNSLLVSYNYDGGNPNFARIYTNITVSGGVPVTNVSVESWSGIGSLPDEVYLTVVKASGASAGFTNADMYFGSGTGIGWLSADGTRSNLTWCVLTNSVETNPLNLRGGICMDQTGTFGNQIVAVASSSSADETLKGVWLVDSQANPTLLTRIVTKHLEGVTTLTNDVQKWGPWAGKIITGDEDHLNPVTGGVDPAIYAIATNGGVTMTETLSLITNGIYPEDFEVIPANQSLYITAYGSGSIMELPEHFLAPYAGDLLVLQAGGNEFPGTPGLFIIQWDTQSTNFVTLSVPVPSSVGQIEHAVFAPIQFPGN